MRLARHGDPISNRLAPALACDQSQGIPSNSLRSQCPVSLIPVSVVLTGWIQKWGNLLPEHSEPDAAQSQMGTGASRLEAWVNWHSLIQSPPPAVCSLIPPYRVTMNGYRQRCMAEPLPVVSKSSCPLILHPVNIPSISCTHRPEA